MFKVLLFKFRRHLLYKGSIDCRKPIIMIQSVISSCQQMVSNGPLPSHLKPLFQNESPCKPCYVNMSLICIAHCRNVRALGRFSCIDYIENLNISTEMLMNEKLLNQV